MSITHPYGYIKDGKVFRKKFRDFEDREIGKVEGAETASLEYYENRFSQVEAKFEKLEQAVKETENKGSYLMQLLHLKTYFSEFDALGDFESIYQKMDLIEEQLRGIIAINRAKNLEIKKALLAELTVAVQSNEWKSASQNVKGIQDKWIKTGAIDPSHKASLEGSFQKMVSDFYERKKAFYADLQQMMKDRMADYEAFLEKAKVLHTIQDLHVLRNKIREFKEEWKTLGHIWKEKRDKFWERFQEVIKKSLAAAKSIEKEPQDLTALLKEREVFIEKLKTLASEEKPATSADMLKEEWARLGKLPRKELEPFVNDYKFYLDVISERLFVQQLVRSKGKKRGDSAKNEAHLSIKILRDLLERDRKELHTFEENLGKFNTSGNLDKIIGGKLELQKRKVKVKEHILHQLNTKSNF